MLSNNRFLFIGFGTLGSGLAALLVERFGVLAQNITVITKDTVYGDVLEQYNISSRLIELTPHNFERVLDQEQPFDVMCNLSVNVNSCALIAYCQARGRMYVDTCVELWEEEWLARTLIESTNYQARQDVLGMRGKGKPTCVVAHGANPGLAQHFVKRCLCDLYVKKFGCHQDASFADMAERLGVEAIQIAECDTQRVARVRKANELFNTWSCHGFYEEAFLQPAELGWGTHETRSDLVNTFTNGCQSAVYLPDAGANVSVRSFTPVSGPHNEAKLITHHESIEIADHLTVRRDGQVVYRPTVYYAYRPCDQALASLADIDAGFMPHTFRKEDILDGGCDCLGVLLLGKDGLATWYGSLLTKEACTVPHNPPTTMQVTAGIVAAILWAVEHPLEGVVEGFDLDTEFVMEVAAPFLGELGYHAAHDMPQAPHTLEKYLISEQTK